MTTRTTGVIRVAVVDDHGDHSFFTIDVDFPVAPLDLPASAMTAGETESGDCR